MIMKNTYWTFKIRKQPWYGWLLRIVWLTWLVFWAEVAVGSWKETEPRAFTISLIVFLVSLFLGFLLWLWGYRKFKKANI